MRKHMLVIVVVPITNKGIESQDYKELLKINKKKNDKMVEITAEEQNKEKKNEKN